MFHDAFISYARDDSKDFTLQLLEKLKEAGKDIWFDYERIPTGVDYQREIDKGIESSDYFIFIISPKSIRSEYCLKELEYAIQLNKAVIPICWISVSKQEEKTIMHPLIRRINWVMFEHEPFGPAFDRLLKTMDVEAAYVREHTHWLAKALMWDSNKRQVQYLLVEEERIRAEEWLKSRLKERQAPCFPSDLHCEFFAESKKNVENLMTHVFLTSSTTENDVREALRLALAREGLTAWTHASDIRTGSDFGQAILEGIEQADHYIFLLSPASVDSAYCQKELAYAVSLKKHIIPILVKSTPREAFPESLKNLQYTDLVSENALTGSITLANAARDAQPTPEEAMPIQHHNGFKKLLSILENDPEYFRQHKNLLVKALKWERQSGQDSLLLQGTNLEKAEAWLKTAKQRSEGAATPQQEQYIEASLAKRGMLSTEVFISYSRKDGDFARKLNDQLQEQGKTTWFDQESIAEGEDFKASIFKGIDAADNFLFVISPDALASDFCQEEVEYAEKRNKRFITVLYRETAPNTMPQLLQHLQWIDFQRGFQESFRELLRVMETDREHVRQQTKWQNRALEWTKVWMEDTNSSLEEIDPQPKKSNHKIGWQAYLFLPNPYQQKGGDLLLRGNELALASGWMAEALERQKSPSPGNITQRFVAESAEAVKAQQKIDKLKLRRLRGLFAAALLALMAAIYSYVQVDKEKQRAQQEFERAEKTAVAFTTSELMNEMKVKNPTLAFRLADYAHNLAPELFPDSMVFQFFANPDLLFYSRELPMHGYSIIDARFSADSRKILTGSWDGSARLWDFEGNRLAIFSGHSGGIWEALFSPDGEQVLTASQDSTARLWNMEGQELHIFQHEARVLSATFLGDSSYIVTGAGDGKLYRWNRADGNLVDVMEAHPNGEVTGIVVLDDGQGFFSIGSDYTLVHWQEWAKVKQMIELPNLPLSIAISPDQQQLLLGFEGGAASIWDMNLTKQVELDGHTNSVNDVCFTPNGKYAVTASADSTIRLWGMKGEQHKVFRGHENAVWTVEVSPDPQGHYLLTGSNSPTALIWDRREKQVASIATEGFTALGAYASDEGMFIMAREDRMETVRVYRLSGGGTPDKPRQVSVERVIEQAEGHRFFGYSFDGEWMLSAKDNDAFVWSTEGEILQKLAGHTDSVYDISLSENRLLATSSADSTVRIWDASTGELLKVFSAHQAPVSAVAFSSQEDKVISGDWNSQLYLWSVQDSSENVFDFSAQDKSHTDKILNLVFSHNGKYIVSCGADNSAFLYTTRGKVVGDFGGEFLHDVSSADFSHDDEFIVLGSSDYTYNFYSLNGFKVGSEYVGSGVKEVHFSNNGKYIIAITEAGACYINYSLYGYLSSDALAALQLDDMIRTGKEVAFEDFLETEEPALLLNYARYYVNAFFENYRYEFKLSTNMHVSGEDFEDHAHCQETLKKGIELYTLLKTKIGDEDQALLKAIDLDLAYAYGNLAFFQLYNRKYAPMLNSVEAAKALGPDLLFLLDHQVLAYLFNDRTEEALALARKYRDVPQIDDPDMTYGELFSLSLYYLEEAGITHPDMPKLKAVLENE